MQLSKEKLALIVTQFYCGEHDGAALIHELPSFSPGIHEKEFCSSWEADEQKHDTLFGSIVSLYNLKREEKDDTSLSPSHSMTQCTFNPLMGGIFSIAWDCVHEKDWVKCMTIAAVIEHIALAAGEFLLQYGDEQVGQIVQQILPDEKKHLAFSEQQLQRSLRAHPRNKKKVKQVLFRLKKLSLSLGKKGLFQKHDILISNLAQQRFLKQLKRDGVWCPDVKNTNGRLKNSFYEAGLFLFS